MTGAASRPKITPALAAALAEGALPRIRKRLDGSPAMAEAWGWTLRPDETEITTDGGATVVVSHGTGVVARADQVRCSCLLSPKCLHVLAVVSRLPIDEGAPTEHREAPASASAPDHRVDALDAASVDAARIAYATLARTLRRGLAGVGALERGELLRCVHAARAAGLPRLASRVLSLTEAARAYRESAPDFDLPAATALFGDALGTARRIERGVAELDAVGVSRRRYASIGALRLYGVACEPIATRSGYAGVVSHVLRADADDGGALYTIDDIMPGDGLRARAAYDATIRLGDAALTHGELARGGLFVHGATASADARLGAGASVTAVSASGCSYDEPPLRALFDVPAALQITRAIASGPAAVSPRGASLVFVRGVMEGGIGGRPIVRVEGLGAPLGLATRFDDAGSPSRTNLRVLCEARGARIAVVAHASPNRARVLEVVAIAPLDDGIALPASLGGRAMIGFDVLAASYVRPTQTPQSTLVAEVQGRLDPLAALERRLERLVLAGQRSLTTAAAAQVANEARALERSMLPAGARALEALLVACAASRAPDADLANAWLAAHTVHRIAKGRWARADWLLDAGLTAVGAP
jgi:hypothetical protein